jgi:hypothetical protein
MTLSSLGSLAGQIGLQNIPVVFTPTKKRPSNRGSRLSLAFEKTDSVNASFWEALLSDIYSPRPAALDYLNIVYRALSKHVRQNRNSIKTKNEKVTTISDI